MKRRAYIIGLLCACLGYAAALQAQELELPLHTRGSLGAQLLATPARRDTGNGSGFTAFALRASLVLYQRAALDSSHLRLSSLQLQGQWAVSGIGLTGLQDRAFYTLQLGVTGMHTLGQQGMVLGQLSSFVTEDATSLQRSQPRWLVLAGYVHRTRSVHYLGGLTYSYRYGDGLLLPWLGFRFKLNAHATLALNLPFNTTYTYRSAQDWLYTAFMRSSGGLLRATVNDTQGGQQTWLIRRRELWLGGGLGRRSQDWLWQVQAGLSVGRRIWVRDANDADLATLTPRATLFISASVRYTLRSRHTDRAAIEEFLLNGE